MSEQTEKTATWRDKIPVFIAITTLLLAACATLASFKAGGYGNRMVLAQNQASDQWAYYQAKSIKETQYQVARDTLATASPEPRTETVKQQLLAFEKEVKRYKEEKNEIAEAAKKLEADRDKAREYNGAFGQALMFLQVGILLSSLATINKTNAYWYAGMSVGTVGIGYFVYALFFL